jgi:hypothetical protein
LDIFAGLVTDMAPADLPAGVSPDCQDVAFVPGSVKTRPGLLSMFSPIAGTPVINYMKTYVTQTALLRLLVLDAAGSLWKESPQGVLSLISSSIIPGTFGKSASLFTREYLAIGDGKFGLDIPRQFDDTFLDRVSQEGPGVAPGAADEVISQVTSVSPNGALPFTTTIAASPTGLTQNGFVVTLKTSLLSGFFANLRVGDPIQVSGAGVAGYNGTWTVSAVLGDGLTIQYVASVSGLAASGGGTLNMPLVTYVWSSGSSTVPYADGQLLNVTGMGVAGYNTNGQTVRASSVPNTVGYGGYNVGDSHVVAFGGSALLGLAASGGGTITNAGNIPAGTHKLSVCFQTRQGYITVPAPPTQWTSTGGKRVVVSNIPIGPPNVVARIIIFSLVGQSSFFYSKGIIGIATSNSIIQDNTTTTATFDFSDVGEASQVNADYLFRLVELGECSGVIDYASRLFWWGERNKVNIAEGGGGFNNLSFDGGFGTDGSGRFFPLGWTESTGSYAGGGDVLTNYPTLPVIWGNAYSITGDGATAIRGLMTQSAYQDINGVVILQPNTSYSVRARIAKNSTLAQGAVHVHLQSTKLGIDVGLDVTAAQLSTSYQEFSAVLTSGLSAPPSDLTLKVFADGTPTNNGVFLLENIEPFLTNQPINSSLVRASLVEGPENYDGITGFLNVNENDGFAVRSAFVLRENLYFVKEHGIYRTNDDGVNEPSGWKVSEVSRKFGTPSVNGVAVGEDWAVIADQAGLYITTGGEPRKISQEIQPTWDRINWNFGFKVWVQVDVQNKRIYVGVPLDSATSCSHILMMDYRGIDPPDDMATAAPIHTSYAGKLLVLEKSRKWSPWTIQAASGAMILRFDGTIRLFAGNSVGNGKIYQLTDSQLGTDDGVAIPSYYTTYYHYTHDIEQAFQIGSHNKLFTYLAQFVEGAGNLSVSSVLPGGTAYPIAVLPLNVTGLRDLELPINVTATRSAFKIATDGNVGSWFRLARFITNAIAHPSAPVRGWN